MELLSQGIMQRDHPVITALIYFSWLMFLCSYVMKRRVRLLGLGDVSQ